ncbi:hypothetical protein GF322_00245 [Candidatus Dependentiae bacterium]|nr:hypothetical protein [Candidatus Dependentiae bacterium]
MLRQYFFVNIFLCLLFFFSCSYQKIENTYNKNNKVKMFIAMPENTLVFDNVSPILYKKLCSYFSGVGYKLTNGIKDSFFLYTKIINVDKSQKFVSPDILLYDLRIKLELQCKLFDKNKNKIAEKTFYSYSLISKPSNPIFSSKFFELTYEDISKKIVPKVEQYFRKFL